MSLSDLHDELVIWSLKSAKILELIHDVVNAVSTKSLYCSAILLVTFVPGLSPQHVQSGVQAA